eukprot:m.881814 g.881814  ORF g.881814 m.881814 type:complete len:365 (+) comp23596_c0_seq24:270-1364(+)
MAIGADCPIVRVYDVRMLPSRGASGAHDATSSRLLQRHCPPKLLRQEASGCLFSNVGISGLQFSNHRPGLLVANYRNAAVYLFDTHSYHPNTTGNNRGISERFVRKYSGRTNYETFAKSVCMFGDDAWIASGSDDGSVVIWDTATGNKVRQMIADRRVVNDVAAHPTLPVLAVSGIDHDIKIFDTLSRHRSGDRMLTPSQLAGSLQWINNGQSAHHGSPMQRWEDGSDDDADMDASSIEGEDSEADANAVPGSEGTAQNAVDTDGEDSEHLDSDSDSDSDNDEFVDIDYDSLTVLTGREAQDSIVHADGLVTRAYDLIARGTLGGLHRSCPSYLIWRTVGAAGVWQSVSSKRSLPPRTHGCPTF